ncbi:MAG TPA: hypothetical protein VGL57_03510 [Solirubrobacteraceae bacterium]|jgi:hypothetical protein
MLTVPATHVADLRSGLFGEWGFAAESLSNLALTFSGHGPERVYEVPLRAFDAVRALLNTIGWRVQPVEADVEIDLSLHPSVVLRALRSEQEALVDRLQEVAGTPIPEDAHQAMQAHVKELREFIANVAVLAGSL